MLNTISWTWNERTAGKLEPWNVKNAIMPHSYWNNFHSPQGNNSNCTTMEIYSEHYIFGKWIANQLEGTTGSNLVRSRFLFSLADTEYLDVCGVFDNKIFLWHWDWDWPNNTTTLERREGRGGMSTWVNVRRILRFPPRPCFLSLQFDFCFYQHKQSV